jgi:tRNA A37 threonylcarbamoyladenosine modification protein TsaB
VQLVDVLADAQQDRVYVQRFARSSDSEWSPQTVLSIEPFGPWLSGRTDDTWLTGPGLRVKGRNWPAETQVVPREQWEPTPESLLALGWRRFQAGEADDVWGAEPLYLRPSAAETQWRALGRS